MASIEDRHAEVRRKIDKNKPGYAQSMLGVNDPKKRNYFGEVLVSYDGQDYDYAWNPYPDVPQYVLRDVFYTELVADVAVGAGVASDSVFSRGRIERIVRDLRAWDPKQFKGKHKLAKLLHDFYLKSGAKGERHLK